MEALNTSPQFARQKQIGDIAHKQNGASVLYVMSRDQRVADNHALIAAQTQALQLGLPLAVIFVCNTTTAPRALEHYEFMFTGLLEVEDTLKAYNIPLIGLVGEHVPRLDTTFKYLNPAVIYADFNPLRGPQKVLRSLAKDHPIIAVDTHNIVPVWVASDRQEYGARTLRPKIHRHVKDYCIEPEQLVRHPYDWPNTAVVPFAEVIDIFRDRLATVPKNNTAVVHTPGETAAAKELGVFLSKRFAGFAVARNNPSVDGLSNMSPYLHYGQISSLRVMLAAQKMVQQNESLQQDYDALLEELVVRKELSDNYCYHNTHYDSLYGAAEWAQKTLAKHAADPREFTYTKEQLEKAQTHDMAWNAAQRQLTKTGKMHGYMRMYWAKKVLEWSESPEQALQTLLYLNDFYSIDGGDPNGYVGILWSIAGLHDRPWGERAVYGTIRCMVYSGLQRKFDIGAYIEQNT